LVLRAKTQKGCSCNEQEWSMHRGRCGPVRTDPNRPDRRVEVKTIIDSFAYLRQLSVPAWRFKNGGLGKARWKRGVWKAEGKIRQDGRVAGVCGAVCSGSIVGLEEGKTLSMAIDIASTWCDDFGIAIIRSDDYFSSRVCKLRTCPRHIPVLLRTIGRASFLPDRRESKA